MHRAAASLVLALQFLNLTPTYSAQPPQQLSRKQLEAIAERVAKRHHVDPVLLKAVCLVESAWHPEAEGDDGKSIGLCQIQVSTALPLYSWFWKTDVPMRTREARLRRMLFSPHTNLDISARLLRSYLDMYGGNWILATIAYNGGTANRVLRLLLQMKRVHLHDINVVLTIVASVDKPESKLLKHLQRMKHAMYLYSPHP